MNGTLIEKADVLVKGKLIKTISTEKIEASGVTLINGGGRTLTPGLIDTHVHLMWNMSR
jgi:imidazolonepropionase-like amidohydrolase